MFLCFLFLRRSPCVYAHTRPTSNTIEAGWRNKRRNSKPPIRICAWRFQSLTNTTSGKRFLLNILAFFRMFFLSRRSLLWSKVSWGVASMQQSTVELSKRIPTKNWPKEVSQEVATRHTRRRNKMRIEKKSLKTTTTGFSRFGFSFSCYSFARFFSSNKKLFFFISSGAGIMKSEYEKDCTCESSKQWSRKI